MLKQYKLLLTPQKAMTQPLAMSDAYLLYGSFMQKLPTGCAEALHSSDEPLISQYLQVRSGGHVLWTVNLLNKAECPDAAAVMEDCNEYPLISKDALLRVQERNSVTVNTLDELLALPGGDRDCQRFSLQFVSPASFHVGGEYQFFPTIKHILSSLTSRWTVAFPSAPASDPDAAAALEDCVRITGYELKSSYYRLKGNSIAAFTGSVTLNARLSPPLLQLLRALLAFGTFSGVGIKTALGMGGLAVRELPRRN